MRERIRFQQVGDASLYAMCTDCGVLARLTPAPQWWTVGDLREAGERVIEHLPRCGRPAPGTPGVIPTPDRMYRFVAECMELAPDEYVSIETLMSEWDGWDGNEGHYAAFSTFGRWLRQALPEGVKVERKRLDNQRQNWVIGMRLRK